MIIEKIKFRNIFQYGDKDYEVDFTNLKGINLISGTNGAGKSTLINIISVGHYFEKCGILLSTVVNEINLSGYIQVQTLSYGSRFTIRTDYGKNGIKSIAVTKDGVDVQTGKIPETKQYIETNIIDIPYHIFANVISLSMDDFKSFLTMSAKDTRLIRDKIFGISVFNEVSEKHKAKIKAKNEQMAELGNMIKALEGVLQQEQTELDGCDHQEHQKQLDNYDANILLFETDILNSESELKKLNLICGDIERKNLTQQLSETRTKLAESETKLSGFEAQLAESETKLTNIQSDIQMLKIQTKKFQYAELETKLAELEVRYDVKSSENTKLGQEISQKGTEYNQWVLKTSEFEKDESHNKALENLKNTVSGIISQCDVLTAKQLEYSATKKQLSENTDVLNTKSHEILKNKSRLEHLVSRIELLKSGVCPECGTDLTTHDHVSELNTLESELSELNISHNKLVSEYDSLKISNTQQQKEYDENILKYQSDVAGYQTSVHMLKQEITKLGIDFVIDKIDSIKSFAAELVVGTYNRQLVEVPDFDIDGYEILKSTKSALEKEVSELDTQCRITKQQLSVLKNDDIEKEIIFTTQIPHNELEGALSDCHNTVTQLRLEIQTQTSNIAIFQTNIKNVEEKLMGYTPVDFEYEQDMDTVKSQLTETQSKLTETQSQLNTAKYNKQILDDTFKHKVELIKSRIEKIKQDIAQKTKQKDEIYDDLLIDNIFSYTISEDGIKKYIISQYIPYFNTILDKYLSVFDLPFIITFTDDFTPEINRYGNIVLPKSISTGQRKIVDFCIIMSVIQFLIQHFCAVNLMFLDEIFSSLHTGMIPKMLDIIQNDVCDGFGISVFMINHSPIPGSNFDNSIEIIKKDLFSDIYINQKQITNGKE